MITEAEATRIIRAHIETIIVRYEPLDRIFDPYFVASLLISHPGIGAFIPRNVSTVMKEYVLKIDEDTTSQLVLLMKNQPELLSVANDEVTVNHKSKVLFNATIGSVSMFVI